tara:strand:- start:416 stop:673 length:258 start_codon:yes stop_codon:yes gene_type:complete
MNSKKYIIVDSEYIEYVNFTEVLETSPDTVRYSLNKKKFFLKYNGNQPDFVFNITQDAIGLTEYSHQEILEILEGPEWHEEHTQD